MLQFKTVTKNGGTRKVGVRGDGLGCGCFGFGFKVGKLDLLPEIC